MKLTEKDYKTIFYVVLVAYVLGIAAFLGSFNYQYEYYMACAQNYHNNTRPLINNVTLNDTLGLGGGPPKLIGISNTLYYACKWHWKFRPTFAPAFELYFGIGAGLVLAIAVFYSLISKPRKPAITPNPALHEYSLLHLNSKSCT